MHVFYLGKPGMANIVLPTGYKWHASLNGVCIGNMPLTILGICFKYFR